MPQIMIDTDTESPRSLRMLSLLLQDYAILREQSEAQLERALTPIHNAVAGAAQATEPKYPATEDQKAFVEEMLAPNPAAVFGKNAPVVPTGAVPVAPEGPTLPGNVLPFPGAPVVPTTQ